MAIPRDKTVELLVRTGARLNILTDQFHHNVKEGVPADAAGPASFEAMTDLDADAMLAWANHLTSLTIPTIKAMAAEDGTLTAEQLERALKRTLPLIMARGLAAGWVARGLHEGIE